MKQGRPWFRVLGWAAAAAASLLALALGAGLFLMRGPAVVIAPDASEAAQVAFFLIGDQGSGNWRQWAVADHLERVLAERRGAHFGVLLGDNFYDSGVSSVDDPQWRWKFENMYRGRYLSGMPIFAVLGNHDVEGNAEAQLRYGAGRHGSGRWRMPARRYVRDFGRSAGHPDRVLLRIVFVDTTRSQSTLLDEADFIRESFADGAALWRVVAAHHPIRSHGRYDDLRVLQAGLLAAIKEARVDLWASGHDHNQQVIVAGGEPVYLVNGNGGKSGYPVEGSAPGLLFANEGIGFSLIEAAEHRLSLTLFGTAPRSRKRFLVLRGSDGLPVVQAEVP